jgi:hypothetical protein
MVMWQRYKAETIMALSVAGALFALWYKYAAYDRSWQETKTFENKIAQIKRTAAYKKLWHDPSVLKRLEALRNMVDEQRVRMKKSGNALHARFDALTPKELDRIVTKLLRLPVTIKRFSVTEEQGKYRLEWICGR